jgi:hypothetical protein
MTGPSRRSTNHQQKHHGHCHHNKKKQLCLPSPTKQTNKQPSTIIIMGILMSRLLEGLFGSKEVRILILGLDNAGKTTILYRLQNEGDEVVQTIPTIGFNVETLQYKNIKVRSWFLCSCILVTSCFGHVFVSNFFFSFLKT